MAKATKSRAAALSVFSNTALVLLKLTVGLSIGSVAVISEAIHSATDLIAALIAFFAVRAADEPPDQEHPYGHGKFEAVSGAIEALLIFGAGGYVAFEALRALNSDHEPRALGWGIGVMLLSAVINTVIARYLLRVAQTTDSLALRADAQHLATDVWTSIGVVVGLGLAAITGNPLFDPLVALMVSGVIFFTAFQLTRDTTAPLLDRRLPEEEIRAIENILQREPDVLDWHKLRTRKAGSERHVDVHIQVDDDLSLREAHALTENIEARIRTVLPNAEVIIHTEPYEEERQHHAQTPHRHSVPTDRPG